MRGYTIIVAWGLLISGPLAGQAAQCTYSLSPTSTSVSSSASSGSFSVSVGNTCSWTAGTASSWIHTTSSGTGNGTANYTVDANTGGSRSGTITVGTQSFTVNQGAASLPPVSLGVALDNTNLVWVASSNYPWAGTNSPSPNFDGVDSVISGNPAVPNSESWLQTTVVGPGTVSFWWKVISDPPDELEFYINGEFQDSISDVVDWSYRSFSVPAGTNTLRWVYWKDDAFNAFPDRGWIDQVKYTTNAPIPLATALDTCGVEWTTGGNTNQTNWEGQTAVTHDGQSAAQSGAIYTGQASSMSTVVHGVTNVSFWWKVSSQANYDFLEFRVNGSLLSRISGEVNWQSNFFNLSSGTNVLTWNYVRTNVVLVSQGQNAGWVDQVHFNPTVAAPPVVIYSFTNLVLNSGATCQAALPDLTGTNYFLALASCGSVTVSQSPAPGTLLNLGTNPVILTAVNSYGLTAKSTNSVVVVDVTPPLLTLLGSNPLTLECHASLVDPGATATDNCTVTLSTNSNVLPNTPGTYQIQYVAADSSGNAVTNTRTVQVIDSTPPVVSLNGPAAIVVECHAPFSDPGATANDNCAGSIPALPDHAVNTAVLGTNTIIYIAQDGNGNSGQIARTVIVQDTTPPVFVYTFTNLTLNAAANCQAALPDLTGTNYVLATDTASAVTITQSPAPGSLVNLGISAVVITASDLSGNTASATNFVTVTDVTVPTISSPADLVVTTDPGQPTASNLNLGTPVATDNCSILVVSNNAPATCVVGINLVTWTAVDSSGNIASSLQQVIVSDLELPTMNCPAPVSVCADAGQNFASNVSLGSCSASDNSGVASVTNNAPALFPLGTNLVTWTATDLYGNQNMCVQEIVVTAAPNLPHSITGLEPNGNGTVTVRFAGTFNVLYAVQVSTNLIDWVSIQTNTAGEGGSWSYTDNEAGNFPVRFYRAMRQ